MEPTRLFDVIAHQQQRYARQDMLAAKENGTWRKYSTAEVGDIALRFGAGLLSLGMEGKKIAIISANRPEWMFTDLACQQIGAVLVPIYPTISESELVFVLNDSEAALLFVDDAGMYAKIRQLRDRFSLLRTVYTFDRVTDAAHWSEIPQEDVSRVMAIRESILPDHLVTIIYTSGTTGTPKGVMLSHRNIMSNVTACLPYLPVDEHGRALSFLPLNHIFERMVTYVYLTAGVAVYYAESLEAISDNLREVQPSIFTTVPRLLEKVYEKIMARGAALKGLQRKIFFWAMDIAQQYEINQPMSAWYRLQHRLADRLVFSKWRAALGGNLRAIVTGAAACQLRLLKVFTAADIIIMEGYGLTETSPVISVNRFKQEDRMFGTVGPVISNVEVKLAEDGEIICRGPSVMMGYYKRPDLTAEVIIDGWFHTGDIGVLEKGRFLRITDRKKELFKTSGGKYVAPQPIENKFSESPYIEQIMVVGADRKFAGALIVPNFPKLEDWYRERGGTLPADREFIIHDPAVQKLYKETVDQYNRGFNHIEQVKKFELMPREWTVNGGEITPTLKLKRRVILDKYREAVERIYA